ncbi:hypothetical protein, variant [Verruconis gallopava]|nr:hypothetical protein, variant [Verruconis gallopava]KIW04737.1 hypothetical protein, variant [Verruconis gallopava]
MAVDGKTEVTAPVFHLTDRDKDILAMSDEDYHLQTWNDLKYIISRQALERLTRRPSQLRAYLAWSAETKRRYGTITNFILQERVCWSDYDPASLNSGEPKFACKSTIPFQVKDDYRILINDWPYGLEPGIVHICVWSKVRLPVDDVNGDLTSAGRKMVEEFVDRTFVDGLGVQGEDKVLWFKNWTGLQSVRGLEHIHVLVRDVDENKLSRICERPWEQSGSS